MKHSASLCSILGLVLSNIVLYGLKIIGLAPFSVRIRNARGNNALRPDWIQPFKHSKVGSVYNSLLIIVVLGYTISTFYTDAAATDSESDRTSFSDYINGVLIILREIVATGSSILILVVWILRQRKAAATLNLLCEVGARLFELYRQKTKKWIDLSFVIYYFIITAAVWILFAVFGVDYTSFSGFFTSTLDVVPAIVNFWFAIEYSMIVNFMLRQLETVNQCLTNYQELNCLSPLALQNNAWIITESNDHLASIRLLRNMRATLVELCDDIADFFSLPILFVVLHSFLAFFNDVYIIFINNYKPSERYIITLQAGSTFYLIMLLLGGYIYPLVSLSLNVTRVNQEIGLTGRILNKLLFTVRNGSADEVELLQFSRELLHDRVDIFTAYGLFSLDSTLLPSMMASTATYFVIQLQFRSPSPESGPEPFCNCTA